MIITYKSIAHLNVKKKIGKTLFTFIFDLPRRHAAREKGNEEIRKGSEPKARDHQGRVCCIGY